MTTTSNRDDAPDPDHEAATMGSGDEAFARARARTYALLAATFDGEVDVLRRAMVADDFARFADVVPGDLDAAALGRDDVDAQALQVGYDNLFDVPGPHYVPPFASAHEDDPSEEFESDSTYHEAGEAGELFGDSTVSVSAHYGRFGFNPDRGDGIPDHVAAEFEFMAVLAAGEHTDGDHGADIRWIQSEVLDHLEWVHAFAERVERSDSAEGLYAAVCSFASGFVAWDARRQTEPED